MFITHPSCAHIIPYPHASRPTGALPPSVSCAVYFHNDTAEAALMLLLTHPEVVKLQNPYRCGRVGAWTRIEKL